MVVAVWVLAYGLLKVFCPTGLDIDSAEQVYFAQSMQMGYGSRQPPLYTWLLLTFKPAQASWALSLEVARYACLLMWLGGVQALARVCGANASVQARVILIHLGLLLVMWRVHDSLTHTVLASGITIWGSVALIKALSKPPYWLVVGAISALACLSKLNAALWCVSSLVSAWVVIVLHARSSKPGAVGEARAHLVWMLAALGIFALLMAPYAHWWLNRPSGTVSLARRIVVSDAAIPFWQPALEVVLGSLEYLLLGPLLVAVLAWRLRGRVSSESALPGAQWLMWQTVCGLVLLAVVLTGMKGSHFTPRWLWPVVPGVTVWMSTWAFQVLDRLDDVRWHKVFAVLTLATPLAAIGMVGLRVLEPARNAQHCRNCWTDRPAATLSAELHRLYGVQALRVVTGDDHLAGILVEVAPRDRSWTASSPDLPPPAGFARGDTPCVAAWLDMDEAGPPPEGLSHLMGSSAISGPILSSWPMTLAPHRRFMLQSVAMSPAVCEQAAPQ